MLPEKIDITHFRALRDCTVQLVDSTVLVGPNGAGKSTVLQALRFFFEPGAVDHEDVQHEASDDVSVTVTLGALGADELVAYADFLDADGKLVVTKSGSPDRGVGYSIVGRKFSEFDSLRELENGPATPFNNAYKLFAIENPQYELGKVRSAAEARQNLKDWEADHPESLVEASVAFTFSGSTKTRIIPTTRVVYVPAVHHADEDFKGGRTPLGQMIDALVMPEVEQKPELVELRERWYREYQQLFPSGGTLELQDLASRLSAAIGEFVPGTSVALQWADFVPDVPPPDVASFVMEDDVPTQISQQGHGLQRAMIIALLQARDEQLRESEAEEGDAKVTHVLLLVEEPELYQHPPRSRHFRRVLKKLAQTSGKGARFRVVSTTHSPDFVSLDDIESIRIVRKRSVPGGVPVRTVSSVTSEEVAAECRERFGDAGITVASLQRNLHALDSALREAFFASAIVLTEGVSDIGLLSAEAHRQGTDLEARGIVMASTGGKGQLPLATVITQLLGIRSYVVFDADSAAQLAENQKVLRAIGAAEVLLIGTPDTFVGADYAVLNPKIEKVIRDEVGADAYQQAVNEAGSFFGRADDPIKNPAAAAFVMDSLFKRGLMSKTLFEIVAALSAL